MRILVTWGSTRGGTEGIARMLGDRLQEDGHDVTVRPTRDVRDLSPFQAALIGGALYMGMWHGDATRFVSRHVGALRRVPVWLFSSGPLDDSAATTDIPPTPQVAVLRERIGAIGHRTFGGRLTPDAKGFPAAAMARDHAGDWRDSGQIRAWADDLARALPDAVPGRPIDHPARSVWRLLAYGALLSALLEAARWGLGAVLGPGLAVALYNLLVPLLATGFAIRYFRGRGAREPRPTALAFATLAAVASLAAALGDGFSVGTIGFGTLLPAASIALVTLAVGTIAIMRAGMPPAGLPKPGTPTAAAT